MRTPQIGDIWLRKNIYWTQEAYFHVLILEDRVSTAGNIEYSFLILEKGVIDTEDIGHFNMFCKFIS